VDPPVPADVAAAVGVPTWAGVVPAATVDVLGVGLPGVSGLPQPVDRPSRPSTATDVARSRLMCVEVKSQVE
jgi:hypothetical protein